MRTGDIIAATATGHARGPRALIRLSGPGLRAALAAACPVHPAWPVDGACVGRGEMHLDTRVLPCLVMLFAGPRSYTGEDAAELLIPGNPHLVERVLQAFAQLPGVRPATPGEFSARAYVHGRLSLAQAEGVAATIAARTDDELAAAERLLTGETGQLFLAWRDELATLLALVEAGIDFTDQEDVVPIAPGALAGRLRAVADAVSCHLGSARGDEERQVLPSVALVGAPNAGKSTLFNALLGRRRSVVSPLAGTTRDVLAERLTLEEEGVEVMLLDLAGLDATATGVIERDAQARARAALDAADVLLHCDPRGVFDASVPPGRVRGVIRVRTKADLPAGASPGEAALGVCALDGYNLGTLRRAIADAVAGGEGRASSRVPRHRRALTRTLDGLRAALAHLHPCERERALRSPELTADAMRGALDALAELTGEVTPDDVIGRVFATFCVGK